MGYTIHYNGKDYDCGDTETVLDALLRHGESVPYSCKAGVCHSCLMQALKGQPTEASQAGLKETLKQRNFFLPCSCVPQVDMTVALAGEAELHHVSAEVIDKTPLNAHIMRVRLRPEGEFSYHAGQFVNFFRDESVVRSYSLASVPALEDFLELHVQRLPGGQLSPWIHDQLAVGDKVMLSEALGDCFYTRGDPAQPLLFIGTGSGLAPLYGIVRDALQQGHRGPIYLYHGTRSREEIYLVDELRELAAAHDNVHYQPCLSREEAAGFAHGRANEIALERHPDLKGWRAYLCGNPNMVEASKKKIFLAGAALGDIFADAFVHS